MLGHTILGLETGRDDNQLVYFVPIQKILQSWIRYSWCRLNSNGYSSDTELGLCRGNVMGIVVVGWI